MGRVITKIRETMTKEIITSYLIRIFMMPIRKNESRPKLTIKVFLVAFSVFMLLGIIMIFIGLFKYGNK